MRKKIGQKIVLGILFVVLGTAAAIASFGGDLDPLCPRDQPNCLCGTPGRPCN